MPPLQFHPILKRIRWGGRRLGTMLGKPIGDEPDYAESWEVSCHAHGESVVAGGPHDGETLKNLIREFPEAILGEGTGIERFPLLVKFLDASDRLSVQVHPNDAQAIQYDAEENGKTEAWVILAAEPGSRLYVGLNEGVTPDQLRDCLTNGTVESCLHTIEVSAGDCVFIPAGTVHAIGEGILLAEIQQSSDLTFRLYDWGRLGTDGKPRALHIEDAIACTDFERGPVHPVQPRVETADGVARERLVECPQFVMNRLRTGSSIGFDPDGRFHVVMVVQGTARMHSGDLAKSLPTGQTVLLPASSEKVTFESSDNAELVLIEAHLP